MKPARGLCSDASSTGRPSLAEFAAESLEWPAVRELVANHVASSLGRRALAELAPRDDEDARAALARVGELLALDAGEGPPLAGVVDPVALVEPAETFGRALDGEQLAELARFLGAVQELERWLRARERELPALFALAPRFPRVDALRAAIDQVVDHRGRVRDDASPELRGLRRAVTELTRRIEEAVRRLAGRADLRNVLADGHVGKVHRRGGRPVLAVRARSLGQVPGIVHDRSQSGETLFVEPRQVIEDGNRLAAARSDEAREVSRLLTELTRSVLAERPAIDAAAEVVAEVELAAAGAGWARVTGGRVPRIADDREPGLVLRGARHPLLLEEQRAGRLAEVVPLDLRLGDEFDLLVITGPNTGGKTLSLKTVGLAALLVRLGLPVPCDSETRVPLYTGVAADIGDEQEIAQSLSTFSSHLVRIRAGLERAGPRTLVLLDELGGGTDPDEGAALGAAVLAALLASGAPTLASTHLGQLKHFAFQNARVENASAEFDLETLAPTYRLILGAPGESRALAIARRTGIPSAVVDDAESRLTSGDGDEQALLADIVESRVEAERLREGAAAQLAEAEQVRRDMAAEQGALAERGRLLEAEAQRGVEERLRDAAGWLEIGDGLLHQLPKQPREAVRELLAGLRDALGEAVLSERRREFLGSVKKGDLVYLPRFKKRCQVTRVDRAREQLKVQVGRQEFTVGWDDVSMYEAL